MNRTFMVTKVWLFLFFLLVSLWTSSCKKFEELPVEPFIDFFDFKILVTPEGNFTGKGRLYISYRDGDGDIGLDQNDTVGPFAPDSAFYYNLYVRFFEKQGESMIELEGINFSARIPPLIPKKQKRSIKGIIEYDVDVYDPTSTFDTIQFSIKLADRSPRWSNEIFTPLIIRPKP